MVRLVLVGELAWAPQTFRPVLERLAQMAQHSVGGPASDTIPRPANAGILAHQHLKTGIEHDERVAQALIPWHNGCAGTWLAMITINGTVAHPASQHQQHITSAKLAQCSLEHCRCLQCHFLYRLARMALSHSANWKSACSNQHNGATPIRLAHIHDIGWGADILHSVFLYIVAQ